MHILMAYLAFQKRVVCSMPAVHLKPGEIDAVGKSVLSSNR